jgi:hypothetical protein
VKITEVKIIALLFSAVKVMNYFFTKMDWTTIWVNFYFKLIWSPWLLFLIQLNSGVVRLWIDYPFIYFPLKWQRVNFVGRCASPESS